MIIYESCHRILKTLEDISALFGDKEIAVIRELTKKFEEVKRGSGVTLKEYFAKSKPRGEFVLVF